MIRIWLVGTTPHIDGGLRIDSSIETFVDQINSDDAWIVVDLHGGGHLNLRPEVIIAFQEGDE